LLTNQAWPIDFLLGVTKMLRKPKVVGKFVEFFGKGIPTLSVSERARIRKHNSVSSATMGFSKGTRKRSPTCMVPVEAMNSLRDIFELR